MCVKPGIFSPESPLLTGKKYYKDVNVNLQATRLTQGILTENFL